MNNRTPKEPTTHPEFVGLAQSNPLEAATGTARGTRPCPVSQSATLPKVNVYEVIHAKWGDFFARLQYMDQRWTVSIDADLAEHFREMGVPWVKD